MAIQLPDETKKMLVAAIKHYFQEEREEDIGDLQAMFFLDFILRVVGPSIYNQAVRDAQSVMQKFVAELDVTVFEPDPASTGTTGSGR